MTFSMTLASTIVAALLGLCIVVQAGINRAVTAQVGFPMALFVNSLIVLGFCFLLFWACRVWPELGVLPASVSPSSSSDWRPWMAVSGMCGFLIIFGIPWAVSRMGAFRVFVVLVVAQLFFGWAWDAVIEQKVPEPMRILGGLIAAFGAYLAIR